MCNAGLDSSGGESFGILSDINILFELISIHNVPASPSIVIPPSLLRVSVLSVVIGKHSEGLIVSSVKILNILLFISELFSTISFNVLILHCKLFTHLKISLVPCN